MYIAVLWLIIGMTISFTISYLLLAQENKESMFDDIPDDLKDRGI